MKTLQESRQNRTWLRAFLFLLALVIALPVQLRTATAQEPAPRRNIFDMLFGGPRYERYERYEPYEPRPRRRYQRDGSVIEMRPRPRNRGTAGRAAPPRPQQQAITPPAPEPVAKLENAKQVLVVGDFMAGGVGSELENTFAMSPGVVISERSDGSSGLVRQDHFDWPGQLPVMLDELKPTVVVVMLGANDRQQMSIGSGKEKFRTDAWFKEYEARVAGLAGIVAARKVPLLWVGLPSFQSPSMTSDAVTLNAIYRNQVEKAGGEFVDIWDGFVDEDGKFVITGSDVNGQQVRLRGSDGITFTKAGKQKLAFYVEKFVRRYLGEMASPDLVKLDGTNLPPLVTLPAAPGQAVPVHPISLSDPELDGGKDLLGAGPLPTVMVETPRDKLVKRGELAPPPAGRIDDYRIPAAGAATR
ncbi:MULTISPECIES: DUF459 domain-containing protein [Neorhizobium]|uniref:SGNH/GDSL hydrolase family protein n=1 Tax=unclassified Neorhizobium TaxID=2629175 RepID=UPI001FE213BA|nr:MULTISPECIES: DUF459 domain-containing protein [Neorhizobium]